MESPVFEQIVADRCDEIKRCLAHKAKEYARGDRLHNFKRAGRILRCTPERALVGMLMKHLVSVLDLVDDIDNGLDTDLIPTFNEKGGDAINYLILLEGLIRERAKSIMISPAKIPDGQFRAGFEQ